MLLELKAAFESTDRRVALAVVAMGSAVVSASAAALSKVVGLGSGAILRAKRRLLASGLLERIGGKTSAVYRVLLGAFGGSAPSYVPPERKSVAPLAIVPIAQTPLARVEVAVCYEVRNALDEALRGSSAASLERGRRAGERYAGGFSTLERARAVASWVLEMAESRGEWWQTVANFLGRWYVRHEQKRAGAALQLGCPIDWIVHDGGRGVLQAAALAWDHKRQKERARALRWQRDEQATAAELAEVADACAQLQLRLAPT